MGCKRFVRQLDGFVVDAQSEGWLTLCSQHTDSVHRWPDVYLGLTTMGQHMSIPNLQKALRHCLTAKQSATTSSHPGTELPALTAELMVHPGYPSRPHEGGCGEGPDDFSQSDDRQHELRILSDPSLLALFHQERVQLCAFKDL